ncbi:hypothetical protein M408DRAFT_182865 [Serendipita vermifera MAFF 305830]|uniref:Uncharacterized protein n=1 Tax=Serendipita vermifera MAFF 305830 TaxID=933852 RepID=A0A0C3A4V5_SERVB|nr:hypothetical protein M408DRAFT_182865 [Serendipita vermifera MAFF 305830]
MRMKIIFQLFLKNLIARTMRRRPRSIELGVAPRKFPFNLTRYYNRRTSLYLRKHPWTLIHLVWRGVLVDRQSSKPSIESAHHFRSSQTLNLCNGILQSTRNFLSNVATGGLTHDATTSLLP